MSSLPNLLPEKSVAHRPESHRKRLVAKIARHAEPGHCESVQRLASDRPPQWSQGLFYAFTPLVLIGDSGEVLVSPCEKGDAATINVTSHTGLLLPRGSYFSLSPGDGGWQMAIGLDAEGLHIFDSDDGLTETAFPRPLTTPAIERSLYTLWDQLHYSAAHGDAISTISSFLTLVADALRMEDPRPLQRSPQIAETFANATSWVSRHMHWPISKGDASSAAAAGVSSLTKYHRDFADSTFTESLTLSRLGQARQLLVVHGLPLPEIAEACGFSSSQILIRAVQRIHGVSTLKARDAIRRGEPLAWKGLFPARHLPGSSIDWGFQTSTRLSGGRWGTVVVENTLDAPLTLSLSIEGQWTPLDVIPAYGMTHFSHPQSAFWSLTRRDSGESQHFATEHSRSLISWSENRGA